MEPNQNPMGMPTAEEEAQIDTAAAEILATYLPAFLEVAK